MSQTQRKINVFKAFGLVAAAVGATYMFVKYLFVNKENESGQKVIDMLLRLGLTNVELTDYELSIAANLVDTTTMTVSWDDIGGQEKIIAEIRDKVIFPFRRRDLFQNSGLVQPPKGVLLHGPPGCGKTMIAKATAKAAGARFINLQLSSLFDKWYGESEKRTEAVFSLARKLQPSIVFIDEMDSFLRSRSGNDHETTRMIKTQFMSLWDGLSTDTSCMVIIMGATNRPNDLDVAILRRMPCKLHIGMPDRQERIRILSLNMEKEPVDANIDYSSLGDLTDGFSGSDLREVCREAAPNRIQSYVADARQKYGNDYCDSVQGEMPMISLADLEFGVNKLRTAKQTMIGSV